MLAAAGGIPHTCYMTSDVTGQDNYTGGYKIIMDT